MTYLEIMCLSSHFVFMCSSDMPGMKQRDQEMTETFLVAINCWEFLQSNVTYRGGNGGHALYVYGFRCLIGYGYLEGSNWA